MIRAGTPMPAGRKEGRVTSCACRQGAGKGEKKEKTTLEVTTTILDSAAGITFG